MTTKVKLIVKHHLNDLILEMGCNEKITDMQLQKLKMIKTLIDVYMSSDTRIEDETLDTLFKNVK